MPRTLVVITVIVLVCTASAVAQRPISNGTAGSRETIRAPNCSKKGSKTLKANRLVRVFASPGPPAQGTVYGCLRTASRAFRLGLADGECQNNDTVRLLEVSGRHAAVGIYECSLDSTTWGIGVINLADGRAAFGSPPSGPNSSLTAGLERIVVTPEGAVAWTANRTVQGGVTNEVRRRRHGSKTESVVLDSGTDIDVKSLRKRGHTITWTKAGARRSATL